MHSSCMHAHTYVRARTHTHTHTHTQGKLDFSTYPARLTIADIVPNMINGVLLAQCSEVGRKVNCSITLWVTIIVYVLRCIIAGLYSGSYSGTMMCQYWDNRLTYWALFYWHVPIVTLLLCYSNDPFETVVCTITRYVFLYCHWQESSVYFEDT